MQKWIWVIAFVGFAAMGVGDGRAASTYMNIHDFGSADGTQPGGELLPDGAGGFYGTTNYGGAYNDGTAYHLTPPDGTHAGWTNTVIHDFRYPAELEFPSGLVFGKDGALYGSGGRGGTYDCKCGTIFRLTPPAAGQTKWGFSTLVSFAYPYGSTPAGRLLVGPDGSLYGVTVFGGVYNFSFCGLPPGASTGCGVVFRVSPPRPGTSTWTGTVLHAFVATDGAQPEGGLTGDPRTALYGTTFTGGITFPSPSACTNGCGTVFELRPPATEGGSWAFQSIYQFQNETDGNSVYAPVRLGPDAALYGTTAGGGAVPIGYGQIFRLAPPVGAGAPWTKSTLYAFQGFPDGDQPLAGVAIGPGGALYGTASFGGVETAGLCTSYAGCGTVYRLDPPGVGSGSWTLHVLHAFTETPDGAFPNFPTYVSSSFGVTLQDDSVFGTTVQGGLPCDAGHFVPSQCSGTVFEVSR